MNNKSLKKIIKSGDDYAKIIIFIWMKSRDLYLDPYNSSDSSLKSNISIKTRLKKTIKLIRSIRKQCAKLNKFDGLINLLTYLEIELNQGKNVLDKISQLSVIAQLFDLPESINNLINELGLNKMEDSNFVNEINNLFDNLDDNEIKQNMDSIEESIQEGTLANFLKSKDSISNSSEPRNINLEFKENKKKNKTNKSSKKKQEQEQENELDHIPENIIEEYDQNEQNNFQQEIIREIPNLILNQNFMKKKPILLKPIPRRFTPNPRTIKYSKL